MSKKNRSPIARESASVQEALEAIELCRDRAGERLAAEGPLARPGSPDELHSWLRKHLGVHVPRRAVTEGHAAPFDYLCFAFFEGGASWSIEDPPRSGGPPGADCVVWANRAGGKTYLGALATLLDLVFKPGIAVRILAGSLEQSHRMVAYLYELFGKCPALQAKIKRGTAGRLELDSGSHVEVVAQSQTSVRGTHVQKLRCDEVDLFDPDIWDAAQFVTQGKRCGDIEVRGSVECLSTMQNPHGLMYRLLTEAQEGRRVLFKWGALDVLERCEARECQGSPLAFLEPVGPAAERRATLALPVLPYGSRSAPCPLLPECQGRAKQRKPEECGHLKIEDAIAKKGRVAQQVWETEMLCARPRRTEAVIPEFDVRRHVVDHTPRHALEWFASIDFGIRGPAAILWAALDRAGTLWIVDERFMSDCVLEDHVAAMRAGLAREGVPAWPHPAWVAADPAGNQTNSQSGVNDITLLRKSGFDVKAPRAAIQRGIGLVRTRLAPAGGHTRLFVHRRCSNLIRSLTNYRYKPGDLTSLEPLKDGNDHAVDALRYLVLSLDAGGGSRWGNYLSAA
jgi:hypothetical protein